MTRKEERMRQVRRQKMILAGIFLGIILIAGIFVFRGCSKKTEKKEDKKAEVSKDVSKETADTKPKEKKLPKVEVDLTEINSEYAVLAERETGKIVAEKGSEEKLYPASMTKIMTALVAMENISDLDKMIMYPKSLYGELLEEHPSFAGYEPDEEISVKDLLYGVILPSGAECCKLLAAEAADSEEDFVDMMNEKAEELGMENTHFTNSSGFHDKNHYSTAKDIMILLRSALENKDFYKIFVSDWYTGQVTDERPDGIKFQSTMFEAMDDLEISNEVTGGSILGGKTGYTESAGSCLASLGEVGGNEYILVTGKAERPNMKAHLHVKDAVNVYNQIGEYLKEKEAE